MTGDRLFAAAVLVGIGAVLAFFALNGAAIALAVVGKPWLACCIVADMACPVAFVIACGLVEASEAADRREAAERRATRPSLPSESK